jgi:NADPH-dependent 2,4-dienoyl-CoA reductase/sulfur reductase-like enzyme
MSDFLSSAHHLKPLHEESVSSPSDPMLRRLLQPGTTPHVCVVGAGIAGLRCAEVLINHGLKVTMFEGRDRVGGRVSVLVVDRPQELISQGSTR